MKVYLLYSEYDYGDGLAITNLAIFKDKKQAQEVQKRDIQNFKIEEFSVLETVSYVK